jgi:Flp pilus assembly protein TadG
MFDRMTSVLTARGIGGTLAPLLRRFFRARDATAAVEFTFVATPFLALSLGIIQTGLTFMSSQSLEQAAAVAGRLIMTGQAQSAGWTSAQFKTQVCSQVATMFNCNSNVYIDVETYSSFSAVNTALPISDGTLNTSALGYNPGGPGDVVMVRLYYQNRVFFNGALQLSNLSNGSNLLAATAVFQNEPYSPL